MTSRIQKKLAVSSALAFGLLAACSDDAPNTQAPANSDFEGIETNGNAENICLNENYTGFYAADGITVMCFDAAGNLSFWIGEDGIIGVPESEAGTPSGDTPADTGTAPVEPTSSSAAAIDCDTRGATMLYVLDGITYYRAQGKTFYFDNGCNKIMLAEAVGSSSSEAAAIASSADVAVASSGDSETGSNDTPTPEAVSNGNEPSIAFAATGATVVNDNGCVSIEGSNVTVTCAGNYFFSGSSSNGQIKVLAGAQDNVYLFMNSVTLSNTTSAPVVSLNSNKTFIVANEGTSTFSDASTRNSVISFTNANGASDTTYAGACIFSKDDLTIKGSGTIKVTGNYNNGIHSSDDLRVRDNPTITVTAKNNAFKGKDLVDIEGGTLNLTATSGDGIKSDECTINGNDTTITEGKGIVNIKGGTINIEKAGDDGIQAYNYVFVNDSVSAPKITVKSTGKGIVSDDRIYINAGDIDVTSNDDGIHSNLNVYMNGGNVTVSAGDDGIHADSALHLAGSTINVTKAVQ